MLSNTATLATLLLLAPFASADVIVDLIDGNTDSGWSIIMPDDTANGIVVDAVTDSYVRIEIAKIFTEPLKDGEFTPRTYTFYQRLIDGTTVPTIQITDENIRNLTGSDWTDYHWEIIGRSAAFDRDATDGSGFSTSPLVVKTWGPAQVGWNADHPATLDVEGGVVPNGGVYSPGLDAGKLYIDVDLDQDDSTFMLKQVPTPEPGALILLLLGSGIALTRRLRTGR